MIDALYHNELIPPDLYTELQQLNKYRNLVFHGHVTQVDRAMIDRLKAATAAFEDVIDE
jgi:uncharacterized protein YutE (UPF0331/DUF86 family)